MKNFQNENSQNKSKKLYERKIGVNNQKIYKYLNEEKADNGNEKEKEKEKENISQNQSKYYREKNDKMNSEEYNGKLNHKGEYDEELQNDEDEDENENEINNKNDNHKKKKYNYKYKYKKIKVTEDQIESQDANDKNEEVEENNKEGENEEDDDNFDFEKIKSSPGRIIHQSTEETYDDDGNRVVTTKTIKEFKQITGGVRIKNIKNEKEKIEYERYASNYNKNNKKKHYSTRTNKSTKIKYNKGDRIYLLAQLAKLQNEEDRNKNKKSQTNKTSRYPIIIHESDGNEYQNSILSNELIDPNSFEDDMYGYNYYRNNYGKRNRSYMNYQNYDDRCYYPGPDVGFQEENFVDNYISENRRREVPSPIGYIATYSSGSEDNEEVGKSYDQNRNLKMRNKSDYNALKKEGELITKSEVIYQLEDSSNYIGFNGRKNRKLSNSYNKTQIDSSKSDKRDFQSPDRGAGAGSKKFMKVTMAMISSLGPTCEDRKITRKMRNEVGGVVDLRQELNPINSYTIRKAQRFGSNLNKEVNPKTKLEGARIIQHWWRKLKGDKINRITYFKIIKIQSVIRSYLVRKKIITTKIIYYLCEIIENILYKHYKDELLQFFKNLKKNKNKDKDKDKNRDRAKKLLKNIINTQNEKIKKQIISKYFYKYKFISDYLKKIRDQINSSEENEKYQFGENKNSNRYNLNKIVHNPKIEYKNNNNLNKRDMGTFIDLPNEFKVEQLKSLKINSDLYKSYKKPIVLRQTKGESTFIIAANKDKDELEPVNKEIEDEINIRITEIFVKFIKSRTSPQCILRKYLSIWYRNSQYMPLLINAKIISSFCRNKLDDILVRKKWRKLYEKYLFCENQYNIMRIIKKIKKRKMRIIILIRLTRLMLVFNRRKFLHYIIMYWFIYSISNIKKRNKIKLLYENMLTTYVSMADDIFGNNRENNPSVQDCMFEILDSNKYQIKDLEDVPIAKSYYSKKQGDKKAFSKIKYISQEFYKTKDLSNRSYPKNKTEGDIESEKREIILNNNTYSNDYDNSGRRIKYKNLKYSQRGYSLTDNNENLEGGNKYESSNYNYKIFSKNDKFPENANNIKIEENQIDNTKRYNYNDKYTNNIYNNNIEKKTTKDEDLKRYNKNVYISKYSKSKDNQDNSYNNVNIKEQERRDLYSDNNKYIDTENNKDYFSKKK